MNHRGAVLVQVVVMGVLMAMIATYLMEWAFGRYQLVARHQNSVAASQEVEGCLNEFHANRHAQLSGGTALVAYTCSNGLTVTVTGAAPNYALQVSQTFTTD